AMPGRMRATKPVWRNSPGSELNTAGSMIQSGRHIGAQPAVAHETAPVPTRGTFVVTVVTYSKSSRSEPCVMSSLGEVDADCRTWLRKRPATAPVGSVLTRPLVTSNCRAQKIVRALAPIRQDS